MLNSPTLDVAIGLALIFLLLSLLVSAVCEMLAGFFKWRAANLWDGIEQLLQSKEARNALYNHPLIRGLAPVGSSAPPQTASPSGTPQAGRSAMRQRFVRAIWVSSDVDSSKIPSYIPSKTFALALIDVIRTPHDVDDHVRKALESLAGSASQNPFGYVESVKAQLDGLAVDTTLGPGVRAAIVALRDRLFAAPANALVTSLKASVKQAIAGLQTSSPDAVAAITQWIDSPAAADCPTFRQSLAGAVAQVPQGDATAGARAALTEILSRFSAGTPEQIAGELKAFLSTSTDVRNILNNADSQVKDLARTLLPLLDEAADDTDRFRRNVEVWFNDGMDRVAGWYKRHTTAWQAAIGFLLAVALNVDALQIVRTLYRDPALRQSIASQAQAYANEPHPTLERRGLDFSSAPAADAKSVKVSLSAVTIEPGGTLAATIAVPPGATPPAVHVEVQSAYLVLNTDSAQADPAKWARSLDLPVTAGSNTVKVFGKLNTNVKSESLETFRVTVADVAAPVDASVVARPTADDQFDTLRTKIGALGLPIGWRGCGDDGSQIAAPQTSGSKPSASDASLDPTTPLIWCDHDRTQLSKVLFGLWPMLLGWLITAAAMSLGAPFWFDTLKRFVSIRSAGKAPEEAPLKPKEVPQPAAPQ
ncbi:MAG TPA: hypothetical protein VFI56_27740 [Vicinamibacterales bacterium]|nr:hypothetical protein [Vicinamibacterales bacterium]